MIMNCGNSLDSRQGRNEARDEEECLEAESIL